MIPSDLSSRLRLLMESPLLSGEHPIGETQPVSPAEDVADVLKQGQRFTAQITTPLPNGTYNALVNGRNVTLSLQQSVKSGDSLELVVTDIDEGIVKARPFDTGDTSGSARTEFSSTGQLISRLLTRNPEPAPLAGGRPLIEGTPPPAEKLAPLLQQAVQESGLFYEHHQAEWVSGKRTLEQLLREPQGQLSTPRPSPSLQATPASADTPSPHSEADSPAATAAGSTTTAALRPGMPGGEAPPPANLTASPLPVTSTVPGTTPPAASDTPAPLAATLSPSPTVTVDSSTAPTTPPSAMAPLQANGNTQFVEEGTHTASQPGTQPDKPSASGTTGNSPAPSGSASSAPSAAGGMTTSPAIQPQPPTPAGSQTSMASNPATPTTDTTPRPTMSGGQAGNPVIERRLEHALKLVGGPELSLAAQAERRAMLDEAIAVQEQPASRVTTDNERRSPAIIPDKLMPILHQQLDSIGSHEVSWQGQIWPGQMMDWRITRDELEDPERDAHDQDDDNPTQWQSYLRLQLPHLGDVEARIHLTPAGLALRVLSSSGTTADTLRNDAARLDSALSAAGITLNALSVQIREHGTSS